MGERVSRDFYDQSYFDPGNTPDRVSNYGYYGHSRKMDLKYRLAAEHLLWEVPGLRHGALVVDLGGAKGLLASALQRSRPDLVVVNTDISHYATANALPEVKRRTIESDITAIPIATGIVDLAVSLDVLEHLTEQEVPTALEEIRRILKPHGKGKAILVPNTGEDGDTDRDISHITMRPYKWWVVKAQVAGLEIHDSPSLRLARELGRYRQARRIPTIRLGILAVSTR